MRSSRPSWPRRWRGCANDREAAHPAHARLADRPVGGAAAQAFGYAAVLALLVAHDIPFVEVRPQDWQNYVLKGTAKRISGTILAAPPEAFSR